MQTMPAHGGAGSEGTGRAVAIAGSILGLLALLPGWLTVRPNRVASGSSLPLWEAAGWLYAGVIALLWLLCLALSLGKNTRIKAVVLGASANLALIAAFIAIGSAAADSAIRSGPLSRASPGAGFWLTAAAAYVALLASRRNLKGSPLLRLLVSWTGATVVAGLLAVGLLDSVSVVREFADQRHRFLQEIGTHLTLSTGSVAIGTAIGVPLGIWAVRSRFAERPVFLLAQITQTVPSLALFGLLIAPLSALSLAFPALREAGIRGIGATPALVALVIYSLLPVVQNTYTGLRQVDQSAVTVGLAMGMKRRQVFARIEAPLAAPLLLEGIRTAYIQAIGNTAVAALIGAGGLGWFIFQGLGQGAADLVLLGSLPVIALALAADAAMGTIVRLSVPRGLKRHGLDKT